MENSLILCSRGVNIARAVVRTGHQVPTSCRVSVLHCVTKLAVTGPWYRQTLPASSFVLPESFYFKLNLHRGILLQESKSDDKSLDSIKDKVKEMAEKIITTVEGDEKGSSGRSEHKKGKDEPSSSTSSSQPSTPKVSQPSLAGSPTDLKSSKKDSSKDAKQPQERRKQITEEKGKDSKSLGSKSEDFKVQRGQQDEKVPPVQGTHKLDQERQKSGKTKSEEGANSQKRQPNSGKAQNSQSADSSKGDERQKRNPINRTPEGFEGSTKPVTGVQIPPPPAQDKGSSGAGEVRSKEKALGKAGSARQQDLQDAQKESTEEREMAVEQSGGNTKPVDDSKLQSNETGREGEGSTKTKDKFAPDTAKENANLVAEDLEKKAAKMTGSGQSAKKGRRSSEKGPEDKKPSKSKG